MALPDTLLARLIETVRANDLGGRVVMLGRQRWIGTRRGKGAELFAAAIQEYLPDLREEDLKNPEDGYSEHFFEALGFSQVDSMDYSGFEGASIVQDLAGDLREDLHGAFDVVYDGGTCEHVFDIAQAYRNIDRLLKPGGVLIGHSPCNNWINHAFYQVNPELVYGFWEKAMGYEVLELSLQPLLPRLADKVVRTTNPNITGKRPRLIGKLPPGAQVILNYAVRKPAVAQKGAATAYQTDYMKKWNA